MVILQTFAGYGQWRSLVMRPALVLMVPLMLGFAFVLPSAQGAVLLPGGSGAPDQFPLGYSYAPPGQPARTVVATSSSKAVTKWGSGNFLGDIYEQVESDPSNTFCNGCLDFIIQVQNNPGSTSNIAGISLSGLMAYRTDAGYDLLSVGGLNACGPDDGGFCNNADPNTVPATVFRTADGDTVGFTFPGIAPNESSVDLVIETDATTFTDPTLTISSSNGDTGQLSVLGPSGQPFNGGTSTVPEPSAAVLMITALGLIACKARKRRDR